MAGAAAATGVEGGRPTTLQAGSGRVGRKGRERGKGRESGRERGRGDGKGKGTLNVIIHCNTVANFCTNFACNSRLAFFCIHLLHA